MYAIITTGGKQYRVSPGQTIDVERLPGDEGSAIELNEVLMVNDGEKTVVGQPMLNGAKVKATIVSQGRDKKIIVFKYKSKVRYRRKRGHRQAHTRLAINEIVAN
ncbi:MAG: 50S ribosomal protein L21 [Dehalococcoidia bacterium]|nr:50S ribosomal protein L21 [Dehalococcoidia bacterium]